MDCCWVNNSRVDAVITWCDEGGIVPFVQCDNFAFQPTTPLTLTHMCTSLHPELRTIQCPGINVGFLFVIDACNVHWQRYYYKLAGGGRRLSVGNLQQHATWCRSATCRHFTRLLQLLLLLARDVICHHCHAVPCLPSPIRHYWCISLCCWPPTWKNREENVIYHATCSR